MEGIQSLLFMLGVFWVLLHLLHAIFLRHKGHSFLPTPAGSTLRSRGGTFNTTSLRVVLHKLYLRVEFLGFNRAHDDLTSALKSDKNRSRRRYISAFYDIGVVFCCVGAIFAIGMLFWVTHQLLQQVIYPVSNIPSVMVSEPVRLGKRSEVHSLSVHTMSTPLQGSTSSIQLLIPGLTVPLSHLYPLLLGLLASQIVHEAGHAFAAAVEYIPILSTGISVHLLLPSAFVSLPAAAVQELSPRSRLRVIGAGPFHNLVLWALLVVLSWSGLGALLLSIVGYKDIGHFGRVILDISADSPLRAYIPIGSVITKLNDLPLTSNNPSLDLWTTLLSHPMNSTEDLGWCTEKESFMSQPDACCFPDYTETKLSCFTVSSDRRSKSRIQRCISPLSLVDLDNPLSAKRCRNAPDCTDSQLCVRARSDEELLRITLWLPETVHNTRPKDRATESDASERVVMWSGPSAEVLEEVDVGRHLPRFRFLPVNFPVFLENCFKYLSTLTMSLYLFNLLPLPYLDGEQFLHALLALSLVPSDEFVSLEAGTRVMQTGLSDAGLGLWKRHVVKACRLVVGGLVVICVLLGGMLSLRR